MPTSTHHLSDDLLELYVLRRLPREDVVKVEEHLFLCDDCRLRGEDVADFALAIRDALKHAPAEKKSRWASLFQLSWFRPGFALAGACAAVILAVVLYWNGAHKNLAAMASIQLTAVRGSEAQTAHPARELVVTLTDAPEASRAEVVGAGGSAVWTGSARPRIDIRKPLAPGDYFLRAFSSSGQLLHEYAFHIANN